MKNLKRLCEGSQLKEIVTTSGNRYFHMSDSSIGISKDYFHYIYIVKSFNTLSDTVMPKNLAYFYEVMKRLELEDRTLIYGKNFKFAKIRETKDKSKSKKSILKKYVVKEVKNEDHANSMNMTLVDYRKRLDKAMRNYLSLLVYVKSK